MRTAGEGAEGGPREGAGIPIFGDAVMPVAGLARGHAGLGQGVGRERGKAAREAADGGGRIGEDARQRFDTARKVMAVSGRGVVAGFGRALGAVDDCHAGDDREVGVGKADAARAGQ